MATIGLDMLHYANINENEAGEETYAAPKPLAETISAELSVEIAEAILYADDGASEIVKEFKSGTLTLGVDDLGAEAAAALTGATLDAWYLANYSIWSIVGVSKQAEPNPHGTGSLTT